MQPVHLIGRCGVWHDADNQRSGLLIRGGIIVIGNRCSLFEWARSLYFVILFTIGLDDDSGKRSWVDVLLRDLFPLFWMI